MNVYMYLMGLSVATYMIVNKNNDEIHAEFVPLDKAVAEQYMERGENIIKCKTPPARINESASYYKCKWCDFNEICHFKAPPMPNCRTCKHSEPLPDGTWGCHLYGALLDKVAQLRGCASWAGIPND